MTRTRGEEIALLRDRFVHRDSAFARQWYEPSRNDGGYVKVTEGECPPGSLCPRGACPHKVNVPITDRVLNAHLTGARTIGVYQLDDADTVRWICFDIDKDKLLEEDLPAEVIHENAKETARQVARACQQFGFTPLVEDSGNRGFHVWLFTEPTFLANKARAVGQLILGEVEVLPGLHIELFPKQVSAKSLGNLVKLPLGIHRKSERRAQFVDRHFQPLDDQFAALERTPRIREEMVDILLASAGVVLEPIRRETSLNLDKWTPVCFHTMLDRGISDGARDIGTFKLACYLRDKGLPLWMAEKLLLDWDEELNNPPLGTVLIQSKVDSAYSDGYSWFPCGEYSLDRYCSSSCHRYQTKQDIRNNKPRRTYA